MPRPPRKPPLPPVPEHMCVQCLKRPAYPHNGGLCEVCAPPLRAPKTRAWMAARRAAANRPGCVCEPPGGQPAVAPQAGYGLGA